MSTIYERSTSNPSTQLTTFLEFEFNKTSLVYSGLILVSFRSAWACIRSVHSTYIDVYCFRVVKNTKLFAISASFRFFVRNRGFSLQHGNPKHTHTRRRRGARTETFDTKNCFFLRSKERKRCVSTTQNHHHQKKKRIIRKFLSLSSSSPNKTEEEEEDHKEETKRTIQRSFFFCLFCSCVSPKKRCAGSRRSTCGDDGKSSPWTRVERFLLDIVLWDCFERAVALF